MSRCSRVREMRRPESRLAVLKGRPSVSGRITKDNRTSATKPKSEERAVHRESHASCTTLSCVLVEGADLIRYKVWRRVSDLFVFGGPH